LRFDVKRKLDGGDGKAKGEKAGTNGKAKREKVDSSKK
jgi:hypothetical protein